jgi:hypothetical protein
MPETSKRTPHGDAPAAPAKQSATGVVGRTIDLPRPTPDQQNYLEAIKSATGQYDPDVIIGGPRRPHS